jgi:hypothetical protein
MRPEAASFALSLVADPIASDVPGSAIMFVANRSLGVASDDTSSVAAAFVWRLPRTSRSRSLAPGPNA